ncbi:MAG TPA: VOC family protein [Candidatus Udaeobacter sp.]|jgi:predicted enzyme related to lactoylglutathione lyase
MKINEIAFVCCAVSDLRRARAFYEGILGLKPNAPARPDSYYIEYDVGAGTFAIETNPDWPVSPDGMSVTFEVEDFEAALKHLRDNGIAVFLGPTETKVCRWAAFRDPDGNRLVVHRRK